MYLPVLFRAAQPVDSVNQLGVHLHIKNDTLWDSIAAPPLLRQVDSRPLTYKMSHNWEYGATYRITIDSASVFGMYGNWNKPLKHEFTIKKQEEYSNLYINVSGYPDTVAVVVELLSSDEPMSRKPVIDGVAEFPNLASGNYYVRAFFDTNRNGIWDTGNVSQKIQPEEIYYYDKKIKVKKNWDIEQSWNLYALPIDQQKPHEIKKNKPKRKRGEQIKRQSDDEEEEDEWGNDSFNSFGPGGKSSNNAFGNYR